MKNYHTHQFQFSTKEPRLCGYTSTSETNSAEPEAQKSPVESVYKGHNGGSLKDTFAGYEKHYSTKLATLSQKVQASNTTDANKQRVTQLTEWYKNSIVPWMKNNANRESIAKNTFDTAMRSVEDVIAEIDKIILAAEPAHVSYEQTMQKSYEQQANTTSQVPGGSIKGINGELKGYYIDVPSSWKIIDSDKVVDAILETDNKEVQRDVPAGRDRLYISASDNPQFNFTDPDGNKRQVIGVNNDNQIKFNIQAMPEAKNIAAPGAESVTTNAIFTNYTEQQTPAPVTGSSQDEQNLAVDDANNDDQLESKTQAPEGGQIAGTEAEPVVEVEEIPTTTIESQAAEPNPNEQDAFKLTAAEQYVEDLVNAEVINIVDGKAPPLVSKTARNIEDMLNNISDVVRANPGASEIKNAIQVLDGLLVYCQDHAYNPDRTKADERARTNLPKEKGLLQEKLQEKRQILVTLLKQNNNGDTSADEPASILERYEEIADRLNSQRANQLNQFKNNPSIQLGIDLADTIKAQLSVMREYKIKDTKNEKPDIANERARLVSQLLAVKAELDAIRKPGYIKASEAIGTTLALPIVGLRELAKINVRGVEAVAQLGLDGINTINNGVISVGNNVIEGSKIIGKSVIDGVNSGVGSGIEGVATALNTLEDNQDAIIDIAYEATGVPALKRNVEASVQIGADVINAGVDNTIAGINVIGNAVVNGVNSGIQSVTEATDNVINATANGIVAGTDAFNETLNPTL